MNGGNGIELERIFDNVNTPRIIGFYNKIDNIIREGIYQVVKIEKIKEQFMPMSDFQNVLLFLNYNIYIWKRI